MADFVKLSRSAVKVGKPLLWPVFDAQGNLLLEKGYIVQTEGQLSQLIERGCYCPSQLFSKTSGANEQAPREPVRSKPSEKYQSFLARLEVAHTSLINKQEDAQNRILELTKAIHKFCKDNPDSAIGFVHLKAPDARGHERDLLYCFLCNLLGRQLQWPLSRLGALMSAALTANLAANDLFDQLITVAQELTPEQRQEVRKHPELGARLVYAAGIRNALWIHTIEQHHERFDGGGYPKGLTLDQTLDEARILHLVEHYLALIGSRAYRPVSLASTALLSLQQSDQSERDAEFVDALAELLGPYPPGCFVKLTSGEVGVITRRGKEPQCPQAKAVVRANGEPLFGSLLRDTREEPYRATQMVEPVSLPSVNLEAFWD